MKIENADKSASAGTEAEQSTNADVSSFSQPIAKPNVSSRLYPLVDRLQKHSEWKYPERGMWDIEWYCHVAFQWMGREDELEKRVTQLEREMQSSNGC